MEKMFSRDTIDFLRYFDMDIFNGRKTGIAGVAKGSGRLLNWLNSVI